MTLARTIATAIVVAALSAAWIGSAAADTSTACATTSITGDDQIQYSGANAIRIGEKWSPKIEPIPLSELAGASRFERCQTAWSKMPRSKPVERYVS